MKAGNISKVEMARRMNTSRETGMGGIHDLRFPKSPRRITR
jgi:hypothetical protein